MYTNELAILGGSRVRTSLFPQEAPNITQAEIAAAVSVLEEKRLSIFSSQYINEFESAFAEYIETKYAIAVTSGTAALHTALVAIGVGVGDEVIVPVYTHMSTVNAVMMLGAEPVFVDIDPATFNIDVDLIAGYITPRTKAVILVDLFGLPVNREQLMAVCEKHSLPIVEDCAQSTGAVHKGKRVGSFGIGCHSFGEIKNITTAEGGMITTDDPEIARLARLVRHEGEMWEETGASVIDSLPSSFRSMIYGIDYRIVGHNYRMNALQAAIGLVQLRKLDQLNSERITTANYYNEMLGTHSSLILPGRDDCSTHVYNRFVIRLRTKDLSISRDAFLAALISEGIPAGVYYPVPLNQHTIIAEKGFRSSSRHFRGAEQACEEQIVLPSYPGLNRQDRRDVVTAIDKIIGAVRLSPDIIPVIEQKAKDMKATYFGQFFSTLT